MNRHGTLLVAALVVLSGCVGAVDVGEGDTPAPSGTAGAQMAGAPANGTLEVHFINVGQSSATLVVGPSGETMLVDSGDWRDDGKHVLRYLRQRGIERIDYLVTTHADADHIGGHAAVIEYYETEANGVGAVYDPGIAASTATYEEYLDAVERHNVTLYETRAGDEIPMDGVAVDVLGPPEKQLDGGARNENSVVLRLAHGDVSVLLPGDAEDDQERHLVSTYGDELNATVLAAGHHGSRTSTGEELLDAVDPEVAVISSAYESPYGHPHAETLSRLADRLVPTYWTAAHGDVVMESDGDAVTVRTQRGATTDPSRLRDALPTVPENTTATTPRATISATDGPPPETDDGTTRAVTDGGTAVGIAEIRADASGDDRENLNGEYVTLANAGDDPVDLSGWTLSDESGATYEFPSGTTLAPGESVTVHTGDGHDGGGDLYWDKGRPVWNNDGDTVTLRDAAGDVVVREEYA